jgi:hypothetical protein
MLCTYVMYILQNQSGKVINREYRRHITIIGDLNTDENLTGLTEIDVNFYVMLTNLKAHGPIKGDNQVSAKN